MGKHKISNGYSSATNPIYFKFGLQGNEDFAVSLLKDFPMEARNKVIASAQVAAVNALLSNIPNGSTLKIRNYSKLKNDDRGFSRQIFLAVLNHLAKESLITREGKGFSRSVITYSPRIMRYIPYNVVHHPESPIITKINGERTVVKINTEERRILKNRLKAWWEFVKQHDIDPGITSNDFKLFNDCETLVIGKPPLIKPQCTDILPYIIYNDRDLTKGGRMYGAFWIGMKKELRRAIKIDGSKTCDIDGKGMHVQLLYKTIGEPLPDGDIYIYTDERRRITKGLMILMMNTKEECRPEIGRKRVKRTYKKKFSRDDEGLDEFILDLEGFHHKILHLLYRPNWGRLQHTEAAIMLNIMEAAMKEDIVVLPVHDGCLCKLEHKEKVLQLFTDQEIEAEENEKHLLPIPLKETKAFLKAFYELQKVA
ncbi:hypothetical protein ACFLZQ_04110 [Thermodesulfobacteriota bacterium]